MKPFPIAITGMHRSGTSMVTRGLHEAGLTLLGQQDALIDAADDNPEGFWENKRIVACNDDLLEATGGSWDNPSALLPQAVDDPRVKHLADQATEALASLRQHQHWGFKDPRTCLTAPYWLDLEPELHFVICVRHPLEVALSLRRRNQISYSLGLALWERYYETVLETVPAERRLITHYDTYFVDPAGELARVCSFAGLPAADAHVRPDLRHHQVGVSLTEAGVGHRTIELYRDLCAEAGLPQPPTPADDEGHVRRMILDGAVAQRHADQRQEAIDRLEAREAEYRAEIDRLHRDKAGLETDLRNRLRRVETQLAATHKASVSKNVLRAELAPLTEAAAQTRSAVAEIDTVVRHTAGRVEVAVNNSRPGPARRVIRRVGRVAYRGGRRYLFRPARITAERGQEAALPQAKAAARRLPPPAQAALRQGRRVVYRTRRRLAGGPPPQPVAAGTDPTASPGPSPDEWLPSYRAMVSRIVPADARGLVVTDGHAEANPDPDRFAALTHADDSTDLAVLAQIEVGRFAGRSWLLIPEVSREWLARHPTVRDHLADRYPTIVDQPDAGLVFALGQRTDSGARTLRGEVLALTGNNDAVPSVLDWTDLDLASHLPGFTVFTAPDAASLPYLDRSVDIVIADRHRERRDAARVASSAVITVEPNDAGAIEVHSIEAQADADTGGDTRKVLLVTDDLPGQPGWRDRITESAHDAGAELRFAELGAPALLDIDHYDVVVMVEPGVLPLPGSVETAAAAAKDRAVTGKVIAADASLESAGATVFFDRSVGLIGNGSHDLLAPWHDYTRPVCWGAGLVAAPTSMWRAVEGPSHLTGRAFIREWCASVWAQGITVEYQPGITAVRLHGDGGESSGPLHDTAWQRVLDLRPTRPTDLSDGAWRYVLAHDDVEACRG
ncbi:MAG: sulfotransferase [Acidimicrobiia bacterium]|nr:sulfotransferase [Acidimicrobiia bacterium]